MAEPVLFEIYRGDDFTLRVVITTKDTGAAIDVTGWAFKATMKLSTEMLDEEAPVQVDMPAVSGLDAELGVVYIELPATQTKDLIPTTYWFDLQREFSGKTLTVFAGRALVKGDVTRRVG